MPAIRPVLEFAPVSARFDSPTAGDGSLFEVPAGAVLVPSDAGSDADADGVADSAGAGAEAEADSDGSGVFVAGAVGVADSSVWQAVEGVVRLGVMSASTFLPALTWTRYVALGFQSSA